MLTDRASSRPLTVAEFGVLLGGLAKFETAPFLAVATSGGPDSLALALLADRWARARKGTICALTVDHRLRPESGTEVRRLQSWLSARAIRHEVITWSGEKPKSGIQEAARIARYRLLAGWCHDHGCPHLLTAHHRDDQIETHLIRRRARSGADGVAGMSAIRELAPCRVVRPLLGIQKDRLVAFLEVEGQPFITDPSNVDPIFERSRLRGGEWTAPDLDRAELVAKIQAFGRERATRERDRNALLARCVSLHPAGFACFDEAKLTSMPQEMADRVASAVIATIGGGLYPTRRERIARLRDALRAAVNRGYTLGGCRLVRWRGRVLVMRELARAAEPALLGPGESISWDRRFKITLPPAGSRSLTVGYLGPAGVSQLNRLAPQLRRGHLPPLLIPTLPAAWDETGIATVPHLGYRREGASALPQFLFRPVNPLTQAGFAVV